MIVLAAGGSTRMGRSKQLLEFDGEALVRRAAKAAIGSGLGPVVVVLGSEADRVEVAMAGLDVALVRNPRWAEGMGTSIALGVETVARDSGVDAVGILLADQPKVDSAVLMRLGDAWREEGTDAAACVYGSTKGVPAVFGKALFARLKGLPPAGGAKHILADSALKLATIDFPGGLADIDTPEDYRRLMERP